MDFDLRADASFIALEVICLVEQLAYLFLQTRTAQYIYGKLTFDTRPTYSSLKEKGLLLEIIALIPFNLILGIFFPLLANFFEGSLGVKEPIYVIGILRMNRILLLRRLPAQFSIFESKWLKLTPYLNIIRPTFYLAFVWHFTSCLWDWFLSV